MNIVRLSTADASVIEAILKRAGYDTGTPPGYGPKVRAAIGQLAADVAAGRLIVGEQKPITAQVSVPTPATPPTKLGQAIIEFAEPFLDLYETQSNRRWAKAGSNERSVADLFPKLLEREGWYAPLSYCIAATTAFWRGAFQVCGQEFKRYSDLLTLGVVDSYNRCNEAKLITKVPVPGSMMFLRHGDTADGHAGIVIALKDGVLHTLEANTTPGQSSPEMDRNGGCVALKTRPYKFERTSGLWLLGFINPPA